MKLVYTHENRFLVSNARNLLENAGIDALLKNEYAAGGVGDLAVFDTWLELWVDDADYHHAKRLLAAMAQCAERGEWRCHHCYEMNDAAFEVCWQCQHERPEEP